MKLQMLKLWTNQVYRSFSHSGMFWTIPMRTTSSGGSSSAAASRKTIEVWNDRSFDWNRTVKSWATAAAVPRIAKVEPAVDVLPAHEVEDEGRR